MRVGIDSYCYHRLFGEVYPGQQIPEKELSFEDFLSKLENLNVDGVSLESFFLPNFESAYLKSIKDYLDE